MVYICRDLHGEWATVVVGTNPEERSEVRALIERLGWDMVDVTNALTVGMLRREGWRTR
jgi:hypothetical protein